MKKLLLVVLVLIGLQTQAQITCDSITATYLNITQDTIKVETNVISFGIPFTIHSFDLYEGCQNGILTYSDTNVVASIPLPSPNLVDTFVLCNWSDYGVAPYSCYSCDTFAWNNGNWNLLSMIQQPYFCCDSITYWTDQSQGFNIGLDTSGLVHNPDSINVNWGVCTGFATTGMCYSGQGMYAYFGQVMTSDTLKVCYDAFVYDMNSVNSLVVCSHCDYLIFNGFNWVLFNPSNTTSINELTFNRVNDNKIYNMLGKELLEIPTGQMYIQNGKLYIRNE